MVGHTTSPDPLSKRELEILARLASGLADQQIAAQLFLSLNTVKWYNRQIYSKLGVGSRTQAIMYARVFGLLEDEAPTPPLPRSRHNLPAPAAPFIGRSRELAEIKHLLGTYRLVTLTGTGGTGKTRLALQTAAALAASFAEGIRFVDLAPLSDHALVANALAGALGVSEQSAEPLPETLKRVLAQQDLLLLIDTFEHVIQAARLVSELLAAAPRLKVLVTSREPLRLTGEQEYPVPPLSLPLAEDVSPQRLLTCEAGALFVQRVRMIVPRFEVSDENALAIARICRRLDGLPLAIELAAPRCKLLTPQTLLERLEGRPGDSPLQTLAGGSRDAPQRHRTLRDTIAWSYNLLDEPEQALFARLAVFRGGWSLDATEAVCGAGLAIDVLDGLASLVDKSLVQQQETLGNEPRFVLLETIHAYARERLDAGREAEPMQRRHASYFVELAERAEPELRLAHYDHWCHRFELDLGNLRAVLEWALGSGDVALGVRLMGALGLFWHGGRHTEGIRWTNRLLERLDDVPAAYHPKFLVSAGVMAWFYDLDIARQRFMSALDSARELGDQLQMAWALTYLGYPMMRDPESARSVTEEGLALFRELNHQPGIALALNVIGELARLSGDDDRARRAYEECLAVSRATGEARRIGYMYSNLSFIAQHARDHQRAIDLGRRALRLAWDRKDYREIAEALAIIAGSLGALRQPLRAAQLLGASDAALERSGSFHHPGDVQEYDQLTAAVRAQLDDATFLAAWTEGRHFSLEQAVASALGDQMGAMAVSPAQG